MALFLAGKLRGWRPQVQTLCPGGGDRQILEEEFGGKERPEKLLQGRSEGRDAGDDRGPIGEDGEGGSEAVGRGMGGACAAAAQERRARGRLVRQPPVDGGGDGMDRREGCGDVGEGLRTAVEAEGTSDAGDRRRGSLPA